MTHPQTPKLKVALMGAGGKMGCRITDNLKDLPDYDVRYVEVSPEGQARLAERGLSPTPQDAALADADVVVLALPDRLIGRVTEAHRADPPGGYDGAQP
jgi:3-hydroxyisobutyrate dehydrogenase-like beta-hydroxyacid dehydrogenase